MKIFKYPIPIADYFTLDIPEDSEILHFKAQNNMLHIWVLTNPDNKIESRHFSIIGTGHEIDKTKIKKYIGTTQIMIASLVWHLFEMK